MLALIKEPFFFLPRRRLIFRRASESLGPLTTALKRAHKSLTTGTNHKNRASCAHGQYTTTSRQSGLCPEVGGKSPEQRRSLRSDANPAAGVYAKGVDRCIHSTAPEQGRGCPSQGKHKASLISGRPGLLPYIPINPLSRQPPYVEPPGQQYHSSCTRNCSGVSRGV